MTKEGFLAWTEGLSQAEVRALLAMLPEEEEAAAVERDWRASWAHRGQAEPDGSWSTWAIMAGRGFGKTRAGSEWVAERVRQAEAPLRIALVGATLDEARRVMVEGQSGLLAVAEDLVADWAPSLRRLRFRDGSEAALFSGASPEALRGPEHHLAWCDELAKWARAQETWDMLRLGLRLGARPRALVTTTPRPGPVLARILARDGCAVTGGATAANPHNPRAFLDEVYGLYAGTRLGRQELDGELLPDVAGALWTAELIERCRAGAGRGAAEGGFAQVAIGVDPPTGDGTCGIVACALDGEGIGHVLADHSVAGRSPEGWARAVAAAAAVHGAAVREGRSAVRGRALVVAEANQGGRMVESVLRAADAGLKVKLVHAREAKGARADPVATLFEAGKVVLHGRFAELETELLGLVAGGGYEGPGASPDRADAMVWALSELMLGRKKAVPWVRFP